MNDNRYFTEEHQISISTLVLKLFLRWKLILLVACIFAVLGYGFAKYKQMEQRKAASLEAEILEEDLSGEELLEEPLMKERTVDFGVVVENTYEVLRRYETALNNENRYMNHSLLMQMDPYHMVTATQEFEVRAIGEADLNELIMVGRQLMKAAVDTSILSQIAEAHHTDTQYIRELISVQEQENLYGKMGVQNSSGKAAQVSALAMDNEEDTFYFSISVKSDDEAFSKTVLQTIAQYLDQTNAAVAQPGYTLTAMPVYVYDLVDSETITTQNNSRVRAYDYSDRLVKLNTILENAGKIRDTSKKEETVKAHVSGKKYAVFGFIGGAILAVLILLLKILFSDSIETEQDFRSCFVMNNLGTAPVFDEKKRPAGLTGKIRKKLEGLSAYGSTERFYEMTGINVANAAYGKANVLISGSVESDDLQQMKDHLTPKLREKCMQTEFVFGEDLLKSPETRACLQEADGVVLVEKRNHSKVADVKEEIETVTALDKKILGVILL